jgi:mannose-6-phosphate isomerase-like protein (cupin superfamily)
MNEVEISEGHKALYKLEKSMMRLPQVETPTASDFCKGVYARTIFIPKGTLLSGAIHKDECFFVVRSGALVSTHGDDEPQYISAGYMAITPAGSKRMAVALTDVVVTTFHANPEELRDEEKLWENFTLPPPASTLEESVKPELEA